MESFIDRYGDDIADIINNKLERKAIPIRQKKYRNVVVNKELVELVFKAQVSAIEEAIENLNCIKIDYFGSLFPDMRLKEKVDTRKASKL